MLRRSLCIARSALALSLLAAVASADDPRSPHWPQFRGAQAVGVADGAPLPTEWNVDDKRGLRWKTEIPGLAHSSPIIWGDKLFVTTAVSTADNQTLRVGLYGAGDSADDMTEHAFKVYCLDKKTGKILWDKTAHTGVPKVKRHTKATHVNCTPAADEKYVVAFFGSEGLYCYTHDGELKWKKDLGVLDVGPHNGPELQWGFASSPIVYDGKAIVQCDVKSGAFLAAFDLADGKELWRTGRDDVPGWSTPTAWRGPSGPQVICNGCKHMGAFDLKDGKEIWRMSGGGGIPVPAPVVADGLIYLTSNHQPITAGDPRQPVFAVKADAKGELKLEGDEFKNPSVAWMKTRVGSYMQTPLVYRGLVYVCKDNGMLAAFDAKTGEEKFKRRLSEAGTGFTASAVAGDGKLYYTSEEGEVYVLPAGEDRDPLAVNKLGETCLATPAISEGVMYFRGRENVIAIGK